MNRKKHLFLFFILIAILSINSCKNSDWAVKIDDDTISIDEFNKYYYTQNKIFLNMDEKEIDKLAADPQTVNHPTINKSKFMDFLVSRKLIYNKAMEDKTVKKDELNAIIELSKLQAVATYYLTEKLKKDITVTDEEANQFYNENRNMFKGVPIDDNMISRIKQQIFLQKLDQKSNEFILELIAESKVNREGFKKYLNEKDKKEKADAKKDEKKDSKVENKQK